MIAVNVEAVTRSRGHAVTGDTFGVSTLSVVVLLGAGINSLDDTRDMVVIGSDGILDSVQSVSDMYVDVIRKKNTYW